MHRAQVRTRFPFDWTRVTGKRHTHATHQAASQGHRSRGAAAPAVRSYGGRGGSQRWRPAAAGHGRCRAGLLGHLLTRGHHTPATGRGMGGRGLEHAGQRVRFSCAQGPFPAEAARGAIPPLWSQTPAQRAGPGGGGRGLWSWGHSLTAQPLPGASLGCQVALAWPLRESGRALPCCPGAGPPWQDSKHCTLKPEAP